MAKFTKADRQRIIDGYLGATGRNQFVPGEFVDWLSGQPDHEAYGWFFGKDDAEAAREYRIDLARQMASGLRIVSQVSSARSTRMKVATREFPALISPVAGRKGGGGYTSFDPHDTGDRSELLRQGAVSLRSWLNRYRGAAEMAGVNVSQIETIIAKIEKTTGQKAA
ncbi:hypothetical protein [Marinicauda sp. Alg238-R41]|uniref:hypothetical protein n=1 Tax=Marinicauda sp. Alg238-R41 TaxID=2993447 RepID=UPI0022DECFB8|nr:hypothetical protein [Marinicauda sp. Alg238-R41]